ncbi:MAG: hypothetical protein IMZ71_05640, partial [Chloroflexi bacterium]|nr:hypothetical protein [Chloroflexota bacterium]
GKDKNCKQEYYRQEKIDALFGNALDELYVDEAIADQIKTKLQKSNVEQNATVIKDLRRLQSAHTQHTNKFNTIYEDRLSGLISPKEYGQWRERIQNDIYHIEAEIKEIEKSNVRFKDEGNAILNLMKGFKQTYTSQDLKGKAEILGIVLERCYLLCPGGAESSFSFRFPFNFMFGISQTLKSKEGGYIKKSKG